MAADDVLAEAMARIEFKHDLIILSLKLSGALLPQLETPGQSCPVCKGPVEYQTNVFKGVVTRKCGCKTGKIVPDMNQFAPPIAGATGGKTNGNYELEESAAEDGLRRR